VSSAYAEVRVMPICRADALVGWGLLVSESA